MMLINLVAFFIQCYTKLVHGHAVAHAVSPCLPTAAAWVEARFRSCGICGGQTGTGPGFFFQVLWFSQSLITLIAPTIMEGCYKRPNSGQPAK
jgi:hypothetical protein